MLKWLLRVAWRHVLSLLVLLLRLLLWVQVSETVVHALLKSKILLRACFHQRLWCVGDGYRSVLGLPGRSSSLQMGRVVRLTRVLFLISNVSVRKYRGIVLHLPPDSALYSMSSHCCACARSCTHLLAWYRTACTDPADSSRSSSGPSCRSTSVASSSWPDASESDWR